MYCFLCLDCLSSFFLLISPHSFLRPALRSSPSILYKFLQITLIVLILVLLIGVTDWWLSSQLDRQFCAGREGTHVFCSPLNPNSATESGQVLPAPQDSVGTSPRSPLLAPCFVNCEPAWISTTRSLHCPTMMGSQMSLVNLWIPQG